MDPIQKAFQQRRDGQITLDDLRTVVEVRVAELECERDHYKNKLDSAKQKWLSNHSHHDCAACDALEEAFTYTVL